MANIAIEIKVGTIPGEWRKGLRWHISDGIENSKISPETLLEIITTGVEKEFANRGIKDFINIQTIKG